MIPILAAVIIALIGQTRKAIAAAAAAASLTGCGDAWAATTPLTMRQAHKSAIQKGHQFPVPGGNAGDVELSWCNRWTQWRIDCGVTAYHVGAATFQDLPGVSFDPTKLNQALGSGWI